jgi:hypothetical protein
MLFEKYEKHIVLLRFLVDIGAISLTSYISCATLAFDILHKATPLNPDGPDSV